MKNEIYDVNNAFEKTIGIYTGSPYVICVDNCSNALFLTLKYINITNKTIEIPDRTYPSVPCSIIHAGGKVKFKKTTTETLVGAYRLTPTNVWDSALRFTNNMYIPNSYMCLSFSGPYKHLKLGKGGAILTDNYEANVWFRRSRFNGRRECPFNDDTFDMLGWNFYMLPEIASRGLMLMNEFYDEKGIPKSTNDIELSYPDLSNYEIYKK